MIQITLRISWILIFLLKSLWHLVVMLVIFFFYLVCLNLLRRKS